MFAKARSTSLGNMRNFLTRLAFLVPKLLSAWVVAVIRFTSPPQCPWGCSRCGAFFAVVGDGWNKWGSVSRREPHLVLDGCLHLVWDFAPRNIDRVSRRWLRTQVAQNTEESGPITLNDDTAPQCRPMAKMPRLFPLTPCHFILSRAPLGPLRILMIFTG